MRFVDLIEKKVNGLPLSTEEIKWWIESYVAGEIPDYQVSALLMAIIFNSMDERETLDLTMCMAESGDMMDLSPIEGVTVDKHSTGGVGDKTTLVIAPMLAACGASVAKMSGRGLGFTGGTIDKLESIEDFQVNIGHDSFIEQVNDIGLAVVAQSGNLVPADKKLYALRDVTGTVSSIPLIASSIMSKKLAAGSHVIVLDVKYGSGAFMKTKEDAARLAECMISIGRGAGRKVRAVISSMESPLGLAIGNSLEVMEAVETLSGRGPSDLRELCMSIGILTLMEAGICSSKEEAERMLKESIESGAALEKLCSMVSAQGGNEAQIRDISLLPQAKYQSEIKASVRGFVKDEDALALGKLAMEIGAGRAKKDDDIFKEVGIVLCVKPGDEVKEGEALAVVHHREALSEEWIERFKHAFVIEPKKPEVEALIARII